MAILEARNLTVSAPYGTGTVELIKELSFTLPPGRILGLVGESGAGKSMIGRVIANAMPPKFAVTGGSLSFDGEDLLGLAPARRRALLGKDIAFVPQEPLTALNPARTIGSQFDEHLRRLRIATRGERRERALALFDAVHLRQGAEILSKYPHHLGGGRGPGAPPPRPLPANPGRGAPHAPTTALDVTVQARIVRLIAELQARAGTALVFITHDLRLAADLCDEVVVLYAGRLVERAPARQLFAEPSHPYTKCLQLANPGMTGERRALFVLPDQMPGLATLATLQGCRFASRCPLSQPDSCAVREPPLQELQYDHVAACFYTDRIATLKAPPLAFPRPAIPGESAKTPVLDVQDVSKEFIVSHGFFGRRRVPAVRQVDFSIRASEFVGLVGESGSGKSTLAKLVTGLEQPSAGRILFGHDDRQSGLTRRQRVEAVQMVFQDPQSALNPRSRVGTIVSQAMEVGPSRATRADRVARAAELLAEVGMAPEMSNRFPSQLSGGQRQRVNIARALCVLPKLLVADEIVSGLDVSVQAQLLNLLLRLRAELGFAMLFISHDLSVVRYLCDRVLVMYRGEIVEQGATDDVFAAPRHDYTRTLLAAVPADDPTQYRPVIGTAIDEIQIAAQ